MFKKIFLTIFILLIVVIGAVVIFVATFDANQYKEQITKQVNKKTGRDLVIEGDLSLVVYPNVAIELGKATFSNAKGFSAKNFAIIESGRVSVKLMPLLKKQLKVDLVQLNGLHLNLHRKADGSTNWDDLAKAEPSKKAEEKKDPAKVVQDVMANLSVAGVNLKDANIHWQDDQSKQDITLSPLNLETGIFEIGKPLPVKFSVTMKQKSPALAISADGSSTLAFDANTQNFSLDKLLLNSNITGAQIPKGALELVLRGNVKGSSEKVSIPDISLQTTLTGDLVPQGEVKTDVTGNLNFNLKNQQLSIAGLKVDSTVNGKLLEGGSLKALVTGDTQFNLKSQQLSIPNLSLDAKLADGYVKGGAATVKLVGNAQFDLLKQFLSVSNMTLNTNASGEVLKGGKAQATVTGNTRFNLGKNILDISGLKVVANADGGYLEGSKANTQVVGDLQLNLANTSVKMPKLSINSNLEGKLVPGGKLTEQASGKLDLNWGKKQGSVDLSNVLVKLADLQLKGSNVQLHPLAAKPAVSGQFQTNTFNLKQVLKTLGIAVPVMSNPKSLSQVQAQFSLKADTDNADLQNLKLKLDQSTLTGNLAVKNFTTPNIVTKLTIDKINVDDYLAPTVANKPATNAQGSAASGKEELMPLDVLRKLNIEGSFAIGSMVINKLSLSKINAKVSAKQGLININPANASLYKGKYKGRITLDAKQAVPTMKMHHELVGLRSEGLLFDLFQDKYISGGTKLVTDLSSRGNTLNALLQNLNGKSSIAFKDGTIRDSNLAEKISLAVNAFEKTEVKGGKSVVKFTGLSGDWKVNNGVFNTNNLSLIAPYFSATGTGTADVAKQVLDMKLKIGPKAKKGQKALFAPLRIYGPFDDLKFKLDLKDLLKMLAQEDLDKAKLKAKQKLQEAKVKAKEKLALEKQRAKQKLQQKLKAKQDALKLKAKASKAKALKKVEDKVGKGLADKLKQKLGGGAEKAPTDGATEPEQSAEDKLKLKLKNKFKKLF